MMNRTGPLARTRGAERHRAAPARPITGRLCNVGLPDRRSAIRYLELKTGTVEAPARVKGARRQDDRLSTLPGGYAR